MSSFPIRNSSACRTPPRNVPLPVIVPRSAGLPRPVKSPLFDRLSESAERDSPWHQREDGRWQRWHSGVLMREAFAIRRCK
jgi:hypothetical protein